jgi:hypothetical protein
MTPYHSQQLSTGRQDGIKRAPQHFPRWLRPRKATRGLREHLGRYLGLR